MRRALYGADGRIGEMTGPTSCRIGKLLLSGSDLLIAEHLTTGYQAEKRFVEPLKQGDTVAVYRTGEERYIILERLVRV